MNCAKKAYSSEKQALDVMAWHNAHAKQKGWLTAKNVYLCAYCGMWHISTMKPSRGESQRAYHKKIARTGGAHKPRDHSNTRIPNPAGSKAIKKRLRFLQLIQRRLLQPDGTYRKPNNDELQLPIEHEYKVTFANVLEWWNKLEQNKKHNNNG